MLDVGAVPVPAYPASRHTRDGRPRTRAVKRAARRSTHPRQHRHDGRDGGAGQVYDCEADVADGLEALAREELRDRCGDLVRLRRPTPGPRGAGIIRFDYRGDLGALLRLRTVLAVHLVRHYDLPRPRALLGDEHFRALLRQVAAARALSAPDAYHTLYVSAAGADSPVLRRLKEELARHTGLEPVPPEAHAGDLQLRLRRPLDGDGGWEVLVRLSPRPLSARAWRVCNLEGALNATVARAMAILTRPASDDVVLNLACGSGTLLIERLDHAPARRAIGCDLSAEALDCAAENVRAAGPATGCTSPLGCRGS